MLNFADLPGESCFVLQEVVGLEAAEPPRAAAPETAAAYAKARGYDLDGETLGLLRLANLCDLEVVARANRLVSQLAVARGYAPPAAPAPAAPSDADTEASAAAARWAAAAVDAVEDEARRRADALWVAFKRVVAASKGSCVNVWDGPASRLRFAQVPKASSTATMAVLTAAEAPGVLAYVSAADPAGPDAGRRLCYTCPYRAAPPWPPGRPKVAVTFAWRDRSVPVQNCYPRREARAVTAAPRRASSCASSSWAWAPTWRRTRPRPARRSR